MSAPIKVDIALSIQFCIDVIRFSLKETALAGLIAAVYAILGLFFAPISFAVYQIRVAEALTVIPYLSRAAIPGLFAGCAIANMLGSQGWPDIVFGSILTLIAAILTRFSRRFARAPISRSIAVLPVLALWVGGVILVQGEGWRWFIPLACVVAMLLAVLSAWVWISRPRMQLTATVLGLTSLAAVAVALILTGWGRDSVWSAGVGAIALLAAWIMTFTLTRLLVCNEDTGTLLAPLPPVLINAFGVPLYLAPLYGLDYWFSVQMIGVGQLIACYLLGLPLLKLLQKRAALLSLDNPSETAQAQ